MDNARTVLDDVQWCADAYSAVVDADAVVILTEWNEFRGLDLERLAKSMRTPVMVDFRNLFSLSDVRGTGLTYHSLGRATIVPAARADDRIVVVKSASS